MLFIIFTGKQKFLLHIETPSMMLEHLWIKSVALECLLQTTCVWESFCTVENVKELLVLPIK